jgi:hypothetical protein
MVRPFHVGGKIVLQVIWKEKQLKNTVHNNELYNNDKPERAAGSHGTETVQIKCNDLLSFIYH